MENTLVISGLENMLARIKTLYIEELRVRKVWKISSRVLVVSCERFKPLESLKLSFISCNFPVINLKSIFSPWSFSSDCSSHVSSLQGDIMSSYGFLQLSDVKAWVCFC